MQTFILAMLIALGVEANNWRQYEYPHWHRWINPSQGQAFRDNFFRNVYHQNGYPQENINIDQSVVNAEWICRNPNTGNLLIIASQTKNERENQMTKPSDHSFPDSVQEQDQNNWNQENTDSHNARVITEDVTKPNDVKNHGGEGLIDVRLGV